MKKIISTISTILTITLTGALLVGCGEKQQNLNSFEAVKQTGKL